MARFLAILALVFVSACANRVVAPIVETPAETPDETRVIETIFVATNRKVSTAGFHGKGRERALSFMRAEVSVPRDRKPGEVRTNGTRPDPDKHFLFAAQTPLGSQEGFARAIRSELRRLPARDREITLFVHGYNTSFGEGTFRMAQLRHDFKVPGIGVHFSWPSDANPFGYSHDRDSVLFSRDALESVLRLLQKEAPGRVMVVGHSMGSLLVMEALRQMEIARPGSAKRDFAGVVLISPDIDLDLFKMQADRIAALPQPFAIFTSRQDRVLRLSKFVNGSSKRLGRVGQPARLADYPVTLINVTALSKGVPNNHFTPGTSAAFISLVSKSGLLRRVFSEDRTDRTGLLPGTMMTVQKATMLILSPVAAIN